MAAAGLAGAQARIRGLGIGPSRLRATPVAKLNSTAIAYVTVYPLTLFRCGVNAPVLVFVLT